MVPLNLVEIFTDSFPGVFKTIYHSLERHSSFSFHTGIFYGLSSSSLAALCSTLTHNPDLPSIPLTATDPQGLVLIFGQFIF